MSLITRFKKWRAQRIAKEFGYCLKHSHHYEQHCGKKCCHCREEQIRKETDAKTARINKAKLLWDTEKE